MTPEQVEDALRRIRETVATRVVGQDAVIDEALVAFLARGHALLEGVPASAACSSRPTSCPRTSRA